MKNIFNIQLVAYLDNGADFSKVKEELSNYLKDKFLDGVHIFEARIENESGLCAEYHGEIKDSTHLGEIVDYVSNNLNLTSIVSRCTSWVAYPMTLRPTSSKMPYSW